MKHLVYRFLSIAIIAALFSLSSCTEEENTLPTLTSTEVTNIEEDTAILKCAVDSDGGLQVTARGFCWSISADPTLENNNGFTQEGEGVGEFTNTISQLSPNTSYQVRSYGTNRLGTAYGEVQTFSTSMALPTVSTVSVSSITWNAATVAGNATSGGGGDITERGFCWSTAEEPTIDDEKLQKGEGLGEFSLVVENLTPEQTYYLRAYAINAKGVTYGETISFTTLEEPLNVPDNHHMLLGNPSSATDDILNANDYLMVKDQFHLSYNNTTRTANWVSWHLNTSYLGDVGRQDDFRTDYSLPSSWYRVSETSYRYSGFDRGHLCPSADRTATIAANSETFLMTNMMPQAPRNNQGIWAALETYSRNLAKSGKELYIVAGPHGQGGEGSNGYAETIDNNNIVVPSTTWKIIVVLNNGDNDLDRINTNTRVIAVIMPNTQEVVGTKWYDYRVSVNDVEELTGFDFLSNVSTSIQEVIEAVVDNVPI